MAKNSRRVSGSGFVTYKLDLGAAQTSGEILLINQMPVWLLEDTDSADEATCEIIGCMRVVSVAVVGENAAGNAAIAIGARLYIDTDGELNADATNGVFFGYALAAVSSGATTTIDVALA